MVSVYFHDVKFFHTICPLAQSLNRKDIPSSRRRVAASHVAAEL